MICSICKSDVSDDSLYCGKCGVSMIGSDMQITRNEFTHKNKKNAELKFKNGESFGNRYKIIKELGKGGMGQVFKAHDKVLGIDVALKMIKPEFLSNKKMISRFKQEILLAREITHENISRIHDFGDVDGQKFITMEYISGRTLKEIMREEGPFDIEKVIEISKAICSGLEAAHKKQIVHRDLKPQNVMIDHEGHVYITDFGLAMSVRDKQINQTGLVIGTPQYIPPELWKGEEADKCSDIYSVGIIMYEMIAGQEMFRSESDYGYLQKHVSEDPEFPEVIKDKIPGFLKNLVFRCLAKERENRYQNCFDIMRDLNDRIFSRGTLLSEIERSIKKTGPVKIGLSLLLIIVISFIGSFILKKGPPVQKIRSVAILYFKNLSGIEGLDHFSYSLPELLTTDLGQSKYIKVLPEDKVSKILEESNYLGSAFIDENMFEDLGDQAKVNYLVQGSFINSGNNLRISIKLRDSDSGEILSTDYVDVPMDNIFPAIDRLTTGLKRRFNLTENEIFGDIDSEIETITTSSQEALNHFITGKRLFNERKFEESLVEYQRAVDSDPEFAMAYRNMAWSYAYLNDWDNRAKYFEKTIQYIDNLSKREKFLIYGDYYSKGEITFQKSIDSYKKILDIYPYDYEANYQIGIFYRMFDEWDNGIEYLLKALDEDKSSIYALSELIWCLEGKGEYKKAEKLIKQYIENNNDSNADRILYLSYLLKLDQNKFKHASDIVDQRNILAVKENSGFRYNAGVINILQGDFDKASKVVDNLIKSADSRNYPDIHYMKYLYLFQGKFNDYEDQIKKEISKASYIGVINNRKIELIYFYLGSGLYNKATFEFEKNNIIFEENFPTRKFILMSLKIQNELGKGNLELSKMLIDKLEPLAKNIIFKKLANRIWFQVLGKYHEKMGDLKLAEKFYTNSYEYMKGQLDYEYAVPYFFNTSLFYYRQNKYERAEELLKYIHELTYGRLFRGDLYAKSFYYLGKIYQRKGSTKKAINSYNKFYKMWKDGDPEFTGKYIADTEKQLKLLKGDI